MQLNEGGGTCTLKVKGMPSVHLRKCMERLQFDEMEGEATAPIPEIVHNYLVTLIMRESFQVVLVFFVSQRSCCASIIIGSSMVYEMMCDPHRGCILWELTA